VSKEAKPMQSIGYAEVVSHLGGEISLEFLEESIVVSTRQYAKRQVTWFNKVDRAFSMEFPDEAEGVVPQLLDRLNSVYNLGT
ncbi:MAG: hypothetical protein NTV34_19955, partial [Proteobacteria bacterium]|nr:hypothetical protein [Pseudomonadota bacterium]